VKKFLVKEQYIDFSCQILRILKFFVKHKMEVGKMKKLLCLFCSIIFVILMMNAPCAEMPEKIISTLKEKMSPWVKLPPDLLTSLQYNFDVNGTSKHIEVVKGKQNDSAFFWRGISLYTGLEQILNSPDSYELSVEEKPDILILNAKKKENTSTIIAGNGISDSWIGYFSSRVNESSITMRKDNLLPTKENCGKTEIVYSDWLEVKTGHWVPQIININENNGEMVFNMRVRWLNAGLWILDSSEYKLNGTLTSTAHVSNIVLNDKMMEERISKEMDEKAAQRALITEMLDHNKPWLEGKLEGIESIQYTHRTIREDVDEACYVDNTGIAIMEITRDGKGKLPGDIGTRKIILSNNDYYTSKRGEKFATPRLDKHRRPVSGEKIRRYALMGVQFDLPLFSYSGQIQYSDIKLLNDEKYAGHPCKVVEVSNMRDAVLGCGTMFGFTSWSYVHHIYPTSEVLYIDTDHHIPLHENLNARDGKVFEIDYTDYKEFTPSQWAPLKIRIVCKNYFTCEYTFQLIGGKHWLLKEAVSWFDESDKSRGEILDLRINEPSRMKEEALAQIAEAKDLLSATGSEKGKMEVDIYPFRIGKKIPIAADAGEQNYHNVVNEVLFTMNESGDLIGRCRFVSDTHLTAFPITINGVLFDEKGSLLSADSLTTDVVVDSNLLVRDYTLNFGHNDALGKISSFSIGLIKNKETSRAMGSYWMEPYYAPNKEIKNKNTKYMVWNLADGLTSEDPALRSAALERLLYYSDVYNSLHDEHGKWIRNLKQKPSINEIFSPDTRRELIEPLLWLRNNTRDEYERTLIALSLGRFKDKATTTALTESYKNSKGTERLASATGLGILGDEGTREDVTTALNDKNEEIRLNAVWALTVLGGKKSVDVLSNAILSNKPVKTPAPHGYGIDTSYDITRSAILKGLLVLGDKSCLPAIKELQKNEKDYFFHGRDLNRIIELIEKP